MTPEEAFLEDICEHPEDDTPRLIFADWLEEHDNPERAEFIRLQCDLAGRGDSDPVVLRARPREQTLLRQHGNDWLGPLRDLGIVLEPGPPEHPWIQTPFYHIAGFARGFVDRVALPYDDFVFRAERLFEAGPTIRSIRLVRTGRDLPSTPADVEILADSSELGRLLTLDLSRLFIGDDRVSRIVASPNLYRLRRLHLGLASVGGSRSVLAVARNPSLAGLSTLDLSSLSIGGGVIAALTSASHLANLHTLDLSRNSLDAQAAVYLAGTANLAGLRSLNLEYNRIDDDGARALADSPHLSHLTALNLGHNHLSLSSHRVLSERFGAALRI
jgi:uncharacterized protein (TIGR02996 family)